MGCTRHDVEAYLNISRFSWMSFTSCLGTEHEMMLIQLSRTAFQLLTMTTAMKTAKTMIAARTEPKMSKWPRTKLPPSPPSTSEAICISRPSSSSPEMWGLFFFSPLWRGRIMTAKWVRWSHSHTVVVALEEDTRQPASDQRL